MLSAIQLKRHFFTHVAVEIDDRCKGKPKEETYEIDIGTSEPTLDSDNNLWKLSMQVEFSSPELAKPARYKGRVNLTGLFSLASDFDESKRLNFIRMNGGSLLLGAAREMVATITARGSRGILHLATFDARMFMKTEPAEAPEEEQEAKGGNTSE